ncbi:MAG: hypothetical protein EOO38_07430 [Cytophagaceae bacterium]|nr:MAG: hypothetical protein EOO38_07430 [Cytophagaceae bacterium]
MSTDWQTLAAAFSCYVNAENRLLTFDYSEERQTLLKVAALLIRMADNDYTTGETGLGDDRLGTATQLLHIAVDD